MFRITRKSQFHIVIRTNRGVSHYDFRMLVKMTKKMTEYLSVLAQNKLITHKPEEDLRARLELYEMYKQRIKYYKRLIRFIVNRFPSLRSYI